MKLKVEIITDDGSIYVGEALLHDRKGKPSPIESVISKTPSRVVKCPNALKLLWARGQFKSQLSLSEVKTVLKDIGGYTYPDSTLSMALSKASFLTQKGTKRSYAWTQKYPYTG